MSLPIMTLFIHVSGACEHDGPWSDAGDTRLGAGEDNSVVITTSISEPHISKLCVELGGLLSLCTCKQNT
jgi:hypothetical protein